MDEGTATRGDGAPPRGGPTGRGGGPGLALATMVGLTACLYLRYLAFLKRPVDTAPHGARATQHGPAFAAPASAARAPDPAADRGAYDLATSRRDAPLAEISVASVGALRSACVAPLGEHKPMASDPAVVDGVLHVTSVAVRKHHVAVALGLHAPDTWQTASSPATVAVLALP